MKKVFLFCLTLVVSSNAFAQFRPDNIVYQESFARNLEPIHSMLTTPSIADLEISSKKITYTEKNLFKPYIVNRDLIKMLPELKKIALNRAAQQHNADVLVAATLDITTNSRGRLEITVTGYPATYKNFRKATDAEIEVLSKAKRIPGEQHDKILKNSSTSANLTIQK